MEEILNHCQELLGARRDFLVQWKKKSGRKIIGMMCKYVPEEFIHASGALPVFITAIRTPPVRVNQYLQENTCPLMRACLEGALTGEYDYLDGLVVTHSCDLMSKMHDFWRSRTRIPWVFLLDFPHKINPHTLRFFQVELERFQSLLERELQVEISQASLNSSIRLYNHYRNLLRQLYAMRIQSPIPISGRETLSVLLATMMMPKEEAILLLRNLLAGLGRKKDSLPEGVRVMVTGTDIDHPAFYTLLEECGASIVTDDMCSGSRYFWKPVEEEGPPLPALARRYLLNIPCSRTVPSGERYEHILQLAGEFRVRGVLMPVLHFCDAHSFDAPFLLEKLKKEGLPVRRLEIDYSPGGLEQIRPVVETFVEILKEGPGL